MSSFTDALLTRAEMKEVKGAQGWGWGDPCRHTPCTLSMQGSNGSWVTFPGNCRGGTPLGQSYECWCETVHSGYTKVTSNGGKSRCYA